MSTFPIYIEEDGGKEEIDVPTSGTVKDIMKKKDNRYIMYRGELLTNLNESLADIGICSECTITVLNQVLIWSRSYLHPFEDDIVTIETSKSYLVLTENINNWGDLHKICNTLLYRDEGITRSRICCRIVDNPFLLFSAVDIRDFITVGENSVSIWIWEDLISKREGDEYTQYNVIERERELIRQ